MFPSMTSPLNVSRWRGTDLGLPIPQEQHAVSVCLPRWRDNVGYEEADPAVTGAMQCGYPHSFFIPTPCGCSLSASAGWLSQESVRSRFRQSVLHDDVRSS